MKKLHLYTIKGVLFFSIIALVFTACDSWTETESLEIKQPSVSEILYKKYLENLRSYKESDHKQVIVTFDNSEKNPFSLSQHIASIPDSIDVVSLMYPNNLATWEIDEILEARLEKGIKFILSVSFDALKTEYDNIIQERESLIEKLDEGKDEPEALPDFPSYMVASLRTSISLVQKYDYDGVCFGYLGKSTTHMTEVEKNDYENHHNAFVNVIKDWNNTNSNKLLFFEGKPQNLLDSSFLPSCEQIIIPCNLVNAKYEVEYNIYSAIVDGVPTDRFTVSVEIPSLDSSDLKTGYWNNGNSVAIAEASRWVAENHTGFKASGIMIYNVGNDYHNQNRTYHYSKMAIDNINPSVQN